MHAYRFYGDRDRFDQATDYLYRRAYFRADRTRTIGAADNAHPRVHAIPNVFVFLRPDYLTPSSRNPPSCPFFPLHAASIFFFVSQCCVFAMLQRFFFHPGENAEPYRRKKIISLRWELTHAAWNSTCCGIRGSSRVDVHLEIRRLLLKDRRNFPETVSQRIEKGLLKSEVP